MSLIYTNPQSFNSGIHLNGATPLDDRLQIEDISDIYISNTQDGINGCAIYGMAYDGMVISVVDPNHDHSKDVILIQLKDATPYEYGSPGEVNENNYTEYWSITGKNNDDYIINVLDPSIKNIQNYVNTNNITTVNGSAIDVTPLENENGVGYKYELGVKFDNSTIKVVNDKITGGEYSLSKLSTVDSSIILSSYQLKYKAPGASTFTYIGDKINIPKDFVLEDVYICKATYSGSAYTETAVQDRVTTDEWQAAEGDVYIHFIWNVKSGDDIKTDSYLKVLDIIGDDIKNLQDAVSNLQITDEAINSSINDVSTRLYELSSSVIGGGNYNTNKSNSISMLSSHGNLPAGTTVELLKNMSLSDILTKILFETAVPHKIQTAHATIEWISGSKYRKTVDVGETWPSVDQMKITYYPEKWNWISSQDDSILGTPVNTTGAGEMTYLYNNNSWNSTDTLVEGTTSKFYGTVASVAGDDAVDSLGSTTDDTNTKYRSGIVAQAEYPLLSTLDSDNNSYLTVTAAWKYYHNATVRTDAANAWSNRNTTTSFKGNDNLTAENYITSNVTIYLQWPKLTNSQHAYVYIPNSYKIDTIYGANDTATNTFDVPVGTKVNGEPVTNYGISVDDTVTITNAKNINGTFKKYEINPMSAITTVLINISHV